MKTSLKLSSSLFIGTVIIFFICERIHTRFRHIEEPLSSLVTPIKEIDACVFLGQGDLIRGGKAIVVRLVDATDRHVCLVVVRRPGANEFSAIIVDPPIQWELDNENELVANISIPEGLYDPPKSYKIMKDVEGSVGELIYFIKRYRDPNDREIDIALDALSN